MNMQSPKSRMKLTFVANLGVLPIWIRITSVQELNESEDWSHWYPRPYLDQRNVEKHQNCGTKQNGSEWDTIEVQSLSMTQRK